MRNRSRKAGLRGICKGRIYLGERVRGRTSGDDPFGGKTGPSNKALRYFRIEHC